MKRALLLLFIVYSSLNAQTLQKKASSFFDYSTTFNMGDKARTTVKDNAGTKESIWNVDFYGLEILFPDQPVHRQFLPAITGLGLTYKFSELAHIWGKYTTFKVGGVSLNGGPTEWEQKHLLGGFGIRFGIGDKNRIVLNLGTGLSEVKETRQFGKLNLDSTLILDTKYLWISDNASYGLILTIVEAESKENDFSKYQKGGYLSIGFTAQFGIPNLI